MSDYDTMSTVEMTRDELLSLEDRSAGLGYDRKPGHRFRCDFNICSGPPPRWVVGVFVLDEEMKARHLESSKLLEEAGWSDPFRSLGDRQFVRTKFKRVVITDGQAPEHTLGELQGLVAWAKGMVGAS